MRVTDPSSPRRDIRCGRLYRVFVFIVPKIYINFFSLFLIKDESLQVSNDVDYEITSKKEDYYDVSSTKIVRRDFGVME